MNRKKQQKKTLKRCLAIAMAATCIMSASIMATMPASALGTPSLATADTLVHNASLNKGTISVTNVTPEVGLYVIAYQVLKWENGTGWVYTDTFKDSGGDPYVDIADKQHPTPDETVALSERARVADTEYLMLSNSSGTTFTAANAEPGLYVVMVLGSPSVIYNPALVSVNLSSDLEAQNGTVAMNTRFDNNGSTAYIKSSTVSLTKKIVNVSSDVYSDGFINNNNKDAHGDVVPLSSSGTGVKFVINADIPEYPAGYFPAVQASPFGNSLTLSGGDDLNPAIGGGGGDEIIGDGGDGGGGIVETQTANVHFTLTDLLYREGDAHDHFALDDSTLKVYVKDGGTETEIPACVYANSTGESVGNIDLASYSKDYYSIEGSRINDYTINFSDYFLSEYGGKELVVRYDAGLLPTAGINYDENQTTAILNYTVPDKGDNETVTLTDNTYHYTFASGTAVNGVHDTVAGFENNQTIIMPDIVKVGETAGEASTVTNTTTNTVTRTFTNALEGAQFTLTNNATNAVYTSTSDANGLLAFTGLDTGTYTLEETSAPANYALNTNTYTVPVTAVLNNTTGLLESYTIGNVTYAGTHSTSETEGVITHSDAVTIDGEGDITPIVNTHLDSLPSTGGAGTIALTVGASVAMAGFLAINVINRKRKKDEQE